MGYGQAANPRSALVPAVVAPRRPRCEWPSGGILRATARAANGRAGQRLWAVIVAMAVAGTRYPRQRLGAIVVREAANVTANARHWRSGRSDQGAGAESNHRQSE